MSALKVKKHLIYISYAFSNDGQKASYDSPRDTLVSEFIGFLKDKLQELVISEDPDELIWYEKKVPGNMHVDIQAQLIQVSEFFILVVPYSNSSSSKRNGRIASKNEFTYFTSSYGSVSSIKNVILVETCPCTPSQKPKHSLIIYRFYDPSNYNVHLSKTDKVFKQHINQIADHIKKILDEIIFVGVILKQANATEIDNLKTLEFTYKNYPNIEFGLVLTETVGYLKLVYTGYKKDIEAAIDIFKIPSTANELMLKHIPCTEIKKLEARDDVEKFLKPTNKSVMLLTFDMNNEYSNQTYSFFKENLDLEVSFINIMDALSIKSYADYIVMIYPEHSSSMVRKYRFLVDRILLNTANKNNLIILNYSEHGSIKSYFDNTDISELHPLQDSQALTTLKERLKP